MTKSRVFSIVALALAVIAAALAAQGAANADPRPPGARDSELPSDLVNDWPQLQHDAAHTGWSPETINPPFTPSPFVWRWLDGTGPVSGVLNPVPSGPDFSGMAQPIVAEGKVFMPSMTGYVNAIDTATGNTVWRVQPTTLPILHTLAYDSGVVYAASTDHNVYALNSSNGTLRAGWPYTTGGSISGAVTIYKNGGETYIFVGSSDRYLYALRPDGTLRWRMRLDGPILSTPAVGLVDGVPKVFVGAEDMHAYAYDLSGNRLWKSPQKLYGASFRNYWPVVSEAYNLVFFTTQYPYENGEYGYWSTMDNFLTCLSTNAIGGDAEMAAILNGRAECPQYAGLNNDATRKTFFALRTSDGVQPFQAPITHFASNGTTHASPIIGLDGSIYAYYHVWDRSVFRGQSFATLYSPDVSKMNPANGYRIPIPVASPITTISIAADNIPVKVGGGATIVMIHRYFQGHYVNVNATQPAGQRAADLFWLVTDRSWIPRYAWYRSEGTWEFPPQLRGLFVGESGAAVGPGHRLYVNAGGGMLVAMQASQ
jgi:outer membrane protein assembly factor BamB